MKCPRKDCHEKANIDPTFGVLPCDKCRARDGRIKVRHSPEFYAISRQHRVQEQRDHHMADLLQPFDGNKVNYQFFKRYPHLVKDYGVEEELAKI